MMKNNVFQVIAVGDIDTYRNAAGELCTRQQIVLQAMEATENPNPNRRNDAVVTTVFNSALQFEPGDVVAAQLRYIAKHCQDMWFQDVILVKVVKLLVDQR